MSMGSDPSWSSWRVVETEWVIVKVVWEGCRSWPFLLLFGRLSLLLGILLCCYVFYADSECP
jgi:hypothetical protein